MQSATTGSNVKSYLYDFNGNCNTVKWNGATTVTLSYDFENRVSGISYAGGATNSFTYNGLNLRTGKTDSAGTKTYVTDGVTPASPVLKDGAAVYTPGISERRGSTSSFYHADRLGSTRNITGATQTTTDTLLTDAFGVNVNRTGTNPTPFTFAGQHQYQWDNDSKLMLLGNRYYDPEAGRFLSKDPVKAGDNWYAYCNNNPLSGVDPEGLLKLIITIDPNTHLGSGQVIADPGDVYPIHIGGGSIVIYLPAIGGEELMAPFPVGNITTNPGNSPTEIHIPGKPETGFGPYPPGTWKINPPRKTTKVNRDAMGRWHIPIGEKGEAPFDRQTHLHTGRCCYRHPTNGCIRLDQGDFDRLKTLINLNLANPNTLTVQ